MTLPDSPYYTLAAAAKKLGCSEDELLNLGQNGQLAFHIWNEGGLSNRIEACDFDENGELIARERFWDLNDFLQLSKHTIKEIIKYGSCAEPHFVFRVLFTGSVNPSPLGD